MEGLHSLSGFLRARRAAARPAQAGIDDDGVRRVPGLRREELGRLAGVSVEYYTRLEQGRDRHPSRQVLRALAQPLGLNEAEIDYLFQLAEPRPAIQVQAPGDEQVQTGMLRILDTFQDKAAIIFGRYRDVLAANPVAQALSPGYAVGQNILCYIFLDPQAQEIYRNWSEVAEEAVRTLRVAIGGDLDDRRFTELITELARGSEDFRRLWARQEVRPKSLGVKHFDNPLVGRLSLGYDTMTINGSGGQTLSVYHAAPGSSDEQGLRRLRALTAVSESGPLETEQATETAVG